MVRGRRGAILVVDDDEDLSAAMKDLLEENGFAVKVAHSGGEALAVLRGRARIAVAIVDLMMPGLDGWDLVQEIRQKSEWAQVGIIATSAKGKSPVAGADRFMAKPLRADELLCALLELCEAGPRLRARPRGDSPAS